MHQLGTFYKNLIDIKNTIMKTQDRQLFTILLVSTDLNILQAQLKKLFYQSYDLQSVQFPLLISPKFNPNFTSFYLLQQINSQNYHTPDHFKQFSDSTVSYQIIISNKIRNELRENCDISIMIHDIDCINKKTKGFIDIGYTEQEDRHSLQKLVFTGMQTDILEVIQTQYFSKLNEIIRELSLLNNHSNLKTYFIYFAYYYSMLELCLGALAFVTYPQKKSYFMIIDLQNCKIYRAVLIFISQCCLFFYMRNEQKLLYRQSSKETLSQIQKTLKDLI